MNGVRFEHRPSRPTSLVSHTLHNCLSPVVKVWTRVLDWYSACLYPNEW